MCVGCIITEVVCYFHILQGHLEQAQSSGAGVCVAQSEVTQ